MFFRNIRLRFERQRDIENEQESRLQMQAQRRSQNNATILMQVVGPA